MTTNVSPAEAATSQPRSSGWAPDHDDHFIYWWVKLEGNTQTYVAGQLGVSQGTISRTIKRYERWQTRAEAAVDGRLNHAEKLRAQRWLTYERNELILASCLRIAGEMESCFDVSKSTFLRPLASAKPGHGTEIRTEQHAVDRHGIACRFLRLAHRINMDQHKLVEQAELAPLPPLTPEELAAEEQSAAETRAELRRARQEAAERFDAMRQAKEQPAHCQNAEREAETARLKQIEEAERLAFAEEILARQRDQEPGASDQEPGASEHELDRTPESPLSQKSHLQPADAAGAHNAHNADAAESRANGDAASTCGENGGAEKNSRYARMTPSASRETTGSAADWEQSVRLPRQLSDAVVDRGHRPGHDQPEPPEDQGRPKQDGDGHHHFPERREPAAHP